MDDYTTSLMVNCTNSSTDLCTTAERNVSLQTNETTALPASNAEIELEIESSLAGGIPEEINVLENNATSFQGEASMERENNGVGQLFFEHDDDVSQVLSLLNFREDFTYSCPRDLDTHKFYYGEDGKSDTVEKDEEGERISRLLNKLEHNMVTEKEQELVMIRGELETEQKERMDVEVKLSKLVEFITFVHGEVGKLLQCFIYMSSKNLQVTNVLSMGPFESEQETDEFLKMMKDLSNQFLDEFENLTKTRDLLEKVNLILARVAAVAVNSVIDQHEIHTPEKANDNDGEEDLDYDHVTNNMTNDNNDENNDNNDPADRTSLSSMSTVFLDPEISDIIGEIQCQPVSSNFRKPPRSKKGKFTKRPHGVDHFKRQWGHFCLCGAKFSQKATLTYHVKYFTAEDFNFTCNLCSKQFLYAAQLRHHMFKKHKIVDLVSSGTLTCSRCGTELENRKALMTHIRRTHDWVKLGKTPTQNRSSTINHRGTRGSKGTQRGRGHWRKLTKIKVSPLEKPKECHGFDKGSVKNRCLCGNVYTQKPALWLHICSKKRGKVFCCPICPKKFTHHASVKIHVRNYHQVEYLEGRYGCGDCGKTFETAKEVKNHRRTSHRSTEQTELNSPEEISMSSTSNPPSISSIAAIRLPHEEGPVDSIKETVDDEYTSMPQLNVVTPLSYAEITPTIDPVQEGNNDAEIIYLD